MGCSCSMLFRKSSLLDGGAKVEISCAFLWLRCLSLAPQGCESWPSREGESEGGKENAKVCIEATDCTKECFGVLTGPAP